MRITDFTTASLRVLYLEILLDKLMEQGYVLRMQCILHICIMVLLELTLSLSFEWGSTIHITTSRYIIQYLNARYDPNTSFI